MVFLYHWAEFEEVLKKWFLPRQLFDLLGDKSRGLGKDCGLCSVLPFWSLGWLKVATARQEKMGALLSGLDHNIQWYVHRFCTQILSDALEHAKNMEMMHIVDFPVH